MEKYYLVREKRTEDEKGILGRITTYYGKNLCYTYELPYLDNARDISSIPLGVYECQVIYTEHRGRIIHITRVPNRDSILIHAGNDYNDTQGCVLVGSARGKDGVFSCPSAIAKLLTEVPDRFLLQVKES